MCGGTEGERGSAQLRRPHTRHGTGGAVASADALATAFYVLGVDDALDYCRRHPEIGVVIVGGSEATGPTGVRHAGLTEDELQLVNDEPTIDEGLTPS